MKNINILLPAFLILFFCNNIVAQKNEAWHLVKTPELTQYFGYVWSYNNSPDETRKKCKNHEHSKLPAEVVNRKFPILKQNFTVSSSIFKLGHASLGSGQTKINYSIVDETGTVLINENISLNNTSEKKWTTTNIDVSSYQNKNVTLIISIDEQPKNASLFINLFQ